MNRERDAGGGQVHVELLPVHENHRQALLAGRDALSALTGLCVPTGWPMYRTPFMQPHEANGFLRALPWTNYLFVDPRARTIVGNGGFKSAPDPHGCVDIGYEIAVGHWNRGFATAAIRALLQVAFEHGGAAQIDARTLPSLNAPNRVLRKAGFTFCSEVDDPHIGTAWLWRMTARRWHARQSDADA